MKLYGYLLLVFGVHSLFALPSQPTVVSGKMATNLVVLTTPLSNCNLLGSETFGLGGYDTVRGYDQRDINTDDGLLLSGQIMLKKSPTAIGLQEPGLVCATTGEIT